LPTTARIRTLFGQSLLLEEERSRVIRVLLAVTGGAAAIMAVIGLGRGESTTAAVAGTVVLVVGLGYVFYRRGHLLPTALGLPVVTLSAATVLMFRSGGIHDLAALCLPIVVLVAGLLLGAWAAGVFALLGSAVAFAVVAAERFGWIQSQYAASTQMGDAAIVLVFLAVTAALLGTVLARFNRSLARLQWNEAALEESNRRLASQADELRTSEARGRSLLENAPDRILQVARDGEVELDNRPSPIGEESETPSVYDLVAVEDRAMVEAALESVFERGQAASCEVRGRVADTWLSVRIGPVEAPDTQDSHGGRDGIGSAIVIVTDVSDRRRTEEERDHLQEQLLQAQKMEALGQLAGGVAHDFNNLLTVISGHTSLLAEHLSSDGTGTASLEEIQAAQERAAALTRQLLAFGRRQVLRPRVVDLNELVTGVEDMLGRLIGESVRLECELVPEPLRVLADPVQVEQMVINLAVNARDAMPEGGLLRISTRLHRAQEGRPGGLEGETAGDFAVLVVEDTGTGMDEAIVSHIFEPFFTTKPRGKGTGLGLSSVYGAVRQSGGHVAVRSQPGSGATFEVYLPAVETPIDAPLPSRPATDRTEGSETILLVEDDAPMRRLLARVLEGQGYRVLAAQDGDEALSLASEYDEGIDLLVTDLVMPGLDGRTLATRLRESRDGLPVLFMSGYAHDTLDGALLGGRNGTAEFLQKPFTIQSLGRKIRQILDG